MTRRLLAVCIVLACALIANETYAQGVGKWNDQWLGGKEIIASSNTTLTSDQLHGWPMVNNYGQSAQNVMNQLPAAGPNMGFTAVIGTFQNNTWGFRAAGSDVMYCDDNFTSQTSCTFNVLWVSVAAYCVTFKTGSSTWSWICHTGREEYAHRPYFESSMVTGGDNILRSAMWGGWFIITDGSTVNLPPCVLGMSATFATTSASAFYVNPDDADHFVLDGVALAAGHKLQSPASVTAQVEIVCTNDNVWTVRHKVGTFVDGGA